MSAPTDVYTPWREDREALLARDVGRIELSAAIDAAIDAFVAGRNPAHLYLFAPRGLGKSHLIKLAWDRVRPKLNSTGIPSVLVPEDIPELGSAESILARIASIREGARWLHWRAGPRPLAQGPMVIFFEGLDRQLNALQEEERRKLRAQLDERGPFLLIATGVSLMEGFTQRDTAFFGAFSPWPVPSLTDAESEELLDRLAGEAACAEAWPARRQTLSRLAGGSPRTLVALGRACANAPGAWASEQLYAVVQQFTAHYQMRFRDLSAQQQQLVECLAMAPRELSPTELGEMIGVSVSHASGQARRLVDGGVLLARQDGRSAWYRLAEPLLRYWMEYRNAPWEQTRIGMLGRLLEAVLSPPDLASLWMENPDQEIQAVVPEILERSQARKRQVWSKLVSEFSEAVQRSDLARVEQILARGEKSPPPAPLLVQMASRVSHQQAEVRGALGRLLTRQHLEVIPIAWSFEQAILAGEPVRDAFGALVQQLARSAQRKPASRVTWDHVRDLVVRSLDAAERRGQPWKLQWDETRQLARIPVLRAHFLIQGKRSTHRPVLDPDDVLAAGLGEGPVDLALLVNAAHQRQHQGLFGAVIHQATTALFPVIPFCALAGLQAPIEPDNLGCWINRALKAGLTSVINVLSWAASWHGLGDEVWGELLVNLTRQTRAFSPPTLPVRQHSGLWVALTALGRRAPARLESLVALFADAGPISEILSRALVISSQLAEGATARLHPELAELDRALGAAPAEVRRL